MLTLLAQSPAPAFSGLIVLIIIFVIAFSVFWIWMLVDCLTSSMTTAEKILWTLVILFLHVVGAILYYLIGRRRGNVVV